MFESDTSGCLQQTCARWPGKYYKASLVPRLPRYGWGRGVGGGGGAGNEGILNMLASFPGRSAIKNGRRERPGNEAACAKCMHYMHAAPG